MTHNRDESITRGNLASQPILHQITNPTDSFNEKVILYPEDIPLQNLSSVNSKKKTEEKKGTWWGHETTTGRTAFILNGALMNDALSAKLSPPPKLSRGHIIPQLLSSNDSLTHYVKHIDWSKFANFTLFYFTPTSTQNQGQGQLQRLTWNGQQITIETINKHNFLYLSSTLYQSNDKKIVVNLFNRTLTSQSTTRTDAKLEVTLSAITDSHRTCEYQHLAPQLNKIKENTKTVSLTQIEFNKSNSNTSIYYQDFNQKNKFTYFSKPIIF